MAAPEGELTFRKPIYEPLLARSILEKLGRLPTSILAAEAMRASDRVRDRIRNADMRGAFNNWRAVLSRSERLPTPDDACGLAPRLGDNSCLIEICASGDHPTFRFVRAGGALIDRLGRDFTNETFSLSDQEFIGSLGNAYRRATRGVAYFDYARLPGERDRMLLFERLILPLSANGQSVTHLLSIAMFDDIEVGAERASDANGDVRQSGSGKAG